MKPLLIGTRGSALALWQARHVKRLLESHTERSIELRVIKTQGDRILDAPLAKVGGKGLFVKEIEEALLRDEIDLAIHSMKDVPAEIPAGLAIGAVLEREDPRDALVTREGGALASLREGARVGTSSLRRSAQLRAHRPDLRIEVLRGNVDTRLSRLGEGHLDAIVLAAAGLRRLGYEARISELLPMEVSLPAIGQGALAIEVRQKDEAVGPLVARLGHPPTERAVAAERAFLARLEGGCQTPLAGFAQAGETLRLEGLVASVDGTQILRDREQGVPAQAESVGVRLAERLLARGADRILEAARAASIDVVGGA